MKVLQINSVVNSGSTGRITEDIGRVLLSKGYKSFVAYGRYARPSESTLISIGSKKDIYIHGLITMLFDRHGFGSRKATEKLIAQIEEINPDVIGLHNLHGYYINIQVLFDYLKKKQIPVLWTLFDCWAFTGHCSYFDSINCEKWKIQCETCPKKSNYPSSYFLDNSYRNFVDKMKLFTGHSNLKIVVHSEWLRALVESSFLKNYSIAKIHSGIDLESFRPLSNLSAVRAKYFLGKSKIILGVASTWDERKGLSDFLQIFELIDANFAKIVLVGLTKNQIKKLPAGIIGITRTENVQELASLYSVADVFVNPTWQDNFPTTNLEALASGTPVITYNTGGSAEAVDNETGIVVEKGDVKGLYHAIVEISNNGKEYYSQKCRLRAENLFNKDNRYLEYIKLYETMLNQIEE